MLDQLFGHFSAKWACLLQCLPYSRRLYQPALSPQFVLHPDQRIEALSNALASINASGQCLTSQCSTFVAAMAMSLPPAESSALSTWTGVNLFLLQLQLAWLESQLVWTGSKITRTQTRILSYWNIALKASCLSLQQEQYSRARIIFCQHLLDTRHSPTQSSPQFFPSGAVGTVVCQVGDFSCLLEEGVCATL